MNSYERMMLALNHEIPDTVPIFEILGDHLHQQVCPEKSLLDMYEMIDVDGLWVCEDQLNWEAVTPTIKRDHFGVLRDFHVTEGATFPFPYEPLIPTDADLNQFLENYRLPDPLEKGRLQSLEEMVKRLKGRKQLSLRYGFLHLSFISQRFRKLFAGLLRQS